MIRLPLINLDHRTTMVNDQLDAIGAHVGAPFMATTLTPLATQIKLVGHFDTETGYFKCDAYVAERRLSTSDIEQIIDWGIGNIDESETWWYYETPEESEEPLTRRQIERRNRYEEL